MNENPEIVQPEDWLRPSATALAVPVFLIHDGGGTTFGYHCLEPLDRPVYGIYNPHFRSGGTFEGGISEMGALYSGFVLKAINDPDFPCRKNPNGSVDIILGGWSLGGLLSLEVARQLAEDLSVRIIGILMVDSVCPIWPPTPVRIALPDNSEEGKSKNQILSQRAMAEAGRMIGSWKLPIWDNLPNPRPRTVMVRAKEYTPTSGEGVRTVDVYREDRNLGWDQYDKDMFEDVIDVEGHHYDLFGFGNIGNITVAMRKGLDLLEMVE
ncbi:Fc.00g075050.m01.CDS01 [Cosmosporella sp. VM-42]